MLGRRTCSSGVSYSRNMRWPASIPASVWRERPCPRSSYRISAPAGKCRSRILTILLLVAIFAPFATGQRSSRGSFGHGRFAHASRLSRPSPYESLPFPFLGDFNLDALYSSGYPIAAQPPVILLQAARALSSENPVRPESRDSSTIQPLMIELQNGRYVRVSDSATEGDVSGISSPAQSQAVPPAHSNSRATPTQNVSPAVLIFQDGHSEEVRDYTIAAGVLYARGDYYTDGYWLKPISVSTLNLPQTLQANASRGVKFSLPSSPNEVITSF